MNTRFLWFQRIAAAFAASALMLAFTPAFAFIDYHDSAHPVLRWIQGMPASCALPEVTKAPRSTWTAYWVGDVMDHDTDWFDRSKWRKESVRYGDGVVTAVAVDGFYDARHRIAAYWQGPTDTYNYGVFAGAAPPARAVVNATDLSSVTLGGNIHLGDSTARVASDIRVRTLELRDLAPSCPGYSALVLCNWNKSSCECPRGNPIPAELGIAVFHKDRVVALAWDKSPCFW